MNNRRLPLLDYRTEVGPATALNYFAYNFIKNPSYTPHVPGNGRWRHRSALERGRFGGPLGILRTAEGGKSSVNSYAERVAFGVTHCSMGFLPDPVSPVVALALVPWGIFLFGLAAGSEKRRSKVAHYRSFGRGYFGFSALNVL
jgi:hypothetical protein